MRVFASALLTVSAVATTIKQLVLECDTAGDPNEDAAHCVDVRALVTDYEAQIMAV